jgi:hypothetical protein
MSKLARSSVYAFFAILSQFAVLPAHARDLNDDDSEPEAAAANLETPAEDAAESEDNEPNSSSQSEASEEESEAESEDNVPVEKQPTLFERLPREKLQASLDRTLKQDLPFCTRSDYKARPDPELCKLSKTELQRCPGLKKLCEAPPEPKRRDLSSFAWLGYLGDILFWGIIVVLGVILVLAIARALMSFARERAEASPSPRTTPERPEPTAAEARLPRETDVDRLLARAKAEAAAGRYEEALRYIHGALVHALNGAGHIRVDPARTNGDYLRELRARPQLYAPVREVFRGIEGVQFGGRAPSGELFQQMLDRVLPILRNVITLFALLLAVQSIGACSSAVGDQPERSPRGMHVLTALLQDNGTKVRKRIRDIGAIDPEVAEVLALGEVDEDALKKLLEWVNLGGSLTITTPLESVEAASKIKFNGAPCSGKLALGPGFEATPLKLSALGGRTLSVPAEDEDSTHWTFANCDGRPYVASASYGDGTITVVAESELFSNASLSVGDNAHFAVSLLNSPGHTLEIVGPWTGGGASSPLMSIRNAGLGPALLQLLVFALLFAWHYGTAFGKRRDPLGIARRAFVEHVQALGAVYARARASRFVLAAYGAWAFDRLRERTAPGEAVGVIDLAGAVARKTGTSQAEVVELLAETRHAQEASATEVHAPQDLQTLQRLEALVFRTGGNK